MVKLDKKARLVLGSSEIVGRGVSREVLVTQVSPEERELQECLERKVMLGSPG